MDDLSNQWKVGETVYIKSSYRTVHQRTGKIVKVGRTLVHVEENGNIATYRKEGGRATDGYGSRIQTAQMRLDAIREKELIAQIEEAGFEIRISARPSLKMLTAIADTIKEVQDAGNDNG